MIILSYSLIFYVRKLGQDRFIFLRSYHQLKAGMRKDLEPRSPFQQASGCCLLFSNPPGAALSFSNIPS